jgi:hypothetical protein
MLEAWLFAIILAIGNPVYGSQQTPCSEVLNEHLLYQQTLQLNLVNFMDLAGDLSELAMNYLMKEQPSLVRNSPDLKIGIKDILTHSLHNAVKHSATEMLTADYSNAKSNVDVKVWIANNYLNFEILNAQIKNFPQALQREFTSPKLIKVPAKQRVGYRGAGEGVMIIGLSMNHLSKGSTISWDVFEGRIKFLLRLKLPKQASPTGA